MEVVYFKVATDLWETLHRFSRWPFSQIWAPCKVKMLNRITSISHQEIILPIASSRISSQTSKLSWILKIHQLLVKESMLPLFFTRALNIVNTETFFSPLWDNLFRFFLWETFVDLRSSEILAGKLKGYQGCLVTLQFYFTNKKIHLLALLFSVILGA